MGFQSVLPSCPLTFCQHMLIAAHEAGCHRDMGGTPEELIQKAKKDLYNVMCGYEEGGQKVANNCR